MTTIQVRTTPRTCDSAHSLLASSLAPIPPILQGQPVVLKWDLIPILPSDKPHNLVQSIHVPSQFDYMPKLMTYYTPSDPQPPLLTSNLYFPATRSCSPLALCSGPSVCLHDQGPAKSGFLLLLSNIFVEWMNKWDREIGSEMECLIWSWGCISWILLIENSDHFS